MTKKKKKKKYIREGGICQFWDQWSNGGYIDYQKLMSAIFHPESIESQKEERSEESYIVEKMLEDSEKSTQEENTETVKPFNRNYKNYDTED